MTVTVTDSGIELRPDPSRVITRFFVPGREDVGPGHSRATPVIDRIMGLDEGQLATTMRDVEARFAHRHRGLHETLLAHAATVTSRIDAGTEISPDRNLLLGACFTHEYAIEGAALCNPSAVLHPTQDDSGDVAFVLSVRGIGEGHRSSIGFRTGRLTATGGLTIDEPGAFPETSPALAGVHRRSVMQAKLEALDGDPENAAFIFDGLPESFSDAELTARLDRLGAERATRRNTASTIANVRGLAESSYRVSFEDRTEISERVLWPHATSERHGMEDARFVRFVDWPNPPVYHATYTAFDGQQISQQLLSTTDFADFTVSPIAGEAAAGKGLALFPRQVGGSYVALSRSDRETNAIAFSDDLHRWASAEVIQVPTQPWELLQLGNCGSPIETNDGWLVLTHGVGPMRTYALGAILLDLSNPARVLASSVEPIVTPGDARRDGYVPNVAYSCGGFAHGDTLVLPYGVGDQSIAIATLSLSVLLGSLKPT